MLLKPNEKIRIKLESFNHQLLTLSCDKIIDVIKTSKINNFGIIPLPTNKRIYCVLRSPHVDKDSREHFEIRIHKRIVDIYYDSGINILDLLTQSDLPPGVLYKICLS